MTVLAPPGNRLPRSLLAIARLLVLVWLLAAIGFTALSLHARYQSLRNLEPGAVSQTAFNGWTVQQMQVVVQSLGVRPEGIAIAQLAASLVCLASFWMVGVLLFWRRSDTWVGLLAAFILFATGPGFSNLLLSEAQLPAWAKNIYTLHAMFTWPMFFVMLYLFPNGKIAPRFARYLVFIVYLLFPLASFYKSMDTPGTVILIAYVFGGLVSQVYRYRKVSTLEERQQTKWVVFAIGIILGVAILVPSLSGLSPTLAVGSAGGFWFELIANGIVGILTPALLPLAIGISILRYRLWDIDLHHPPHADLLYLDPSAGIGIFWRSDSIARCDTGHQRSALTR